MKIKIVNEKKFIRSLTCLIMILFISTLGISFSYSKTKVSYKEDYILKGDTLWSIAQKELITNEYYKNKDIRDVIYEIKEINNLKDSNLKIGQKILIPQI